MTVAMETWNEYVARGCIDSDALLDAVTGLISETVDRDALPEMAYIAFSLAAQSFILGSEKLGKLASVLERSFALLYEGRLDLASALPLLASSVETMGKAFAELKAADNSGARIENTPMEAASYELETLFPLPKKSSDGPIQPASKGGPDVLASQLVRHKSPSPSPVAPSSTAPPSEPKSASTWQWTPEVDEDMQDLFFEEVNDRMEGLSVKLLEIEQRPGDIELLRDVFRDWHTIKGSSAMVGLDPMTRLSHAAEDLVGQLREGKRSANEAVVDVLLASLDRLRDITSQAQATGTISVDLDTIFKRLRNPEAEYKNNPKESDATPLKVDSASANKQDRKATIRVDFDKLDSLMNLVGELVLGRDGLGSAISALASLTGELATRHQLSRLVTKLLQANEDAAPGPHNSRSHLQHLAEELSRVERVLVDIFQDLDTSSGRLDSISADLRDSVMNLRMVPVGGTLRKHHRTVRDLAKSLGKEVDLQIHGEDVEFDKLLVEALDEPLMHLMRNAVDHGIELPAVRRSAGKAPKGNIVLRALHKGNQVIIELSDDGKGIDANAIKTKALEKQLAPPEALAAMTDKEALELIFHPGLSTTETVSEVSGRGVGMDVVRQTIVHTLKGSIDITSSPGQGSTFTLRMPLTLAIAQVLLARAGGEVLAIPLDAVSRTLVVPAASIQTVLNREIIIENGCQVPLIRVNQILGLTTDAVGKEETLNVVLCHHGESLYGLVVGSLLEKKEIVIKTLGTVLEEVPCIAGATLLGNRCAVILDIPALIQRAVQGGVSSPPPSSPTPTPPLSTPTSQGHGKSILLVEDSETIRESLRRLLSDAGYRIVLAQDGVEGLAAAKQEQFDLISTDVMMPRMDGYELTRALRQEDNYRNTPIVMVTSRGERIDRVRGFDAGVDEYITKPHDRHLLLRAVHKLLEDA